LLQCFTTQKQNACVPGQGINHALLLMSEKLHYAEERKLDYVLMKLDIAKAFDMLDKWDFLVKLMRKIGFGDKFVGFIEAVQQSASSAININRC
jgi:hypothetical protein